MADETQSLNGDMKRTAVMHSQEMDWQPSPSGTVWRKRLHLVGGAETGQVTSVVRYEAGASFPQHDHPEGEEIFVLEGIFSDEHGDWPAGTHLLNPEGFRHAPFSRDGCVLFVKLRQYAGEGRDYLKSHTREMKWTATRHEGIESKILYRDPRFPDETQLARWSSGARFEDEALVSGCEVFVIEGSIRDAATEYDEGSWLRVPVSGSISLTSQDGAVLYVKTGAVSSLRSVEVA